MVACRCFTLSIIVVQLFCLIQITRCQTSAPTTPPTDISQNKVPGCVSTCSTVSYDRGAQVCYCDELCDSWVGGCCLNYEEFCPNVSATPTCKGACYDSGMQPSGCYCDAYCLEYGDCCDDFQAVCATNGTCAGHCGKWAVTKDVETERCGCDSSCGAYMDCCLDYHSECGSDAPTPAPTGDIGGLDDADFDCSDAGSASVYILPDDVARRRRAANVLAPDVTFRSGVSRLANIHNIKDVFRIDTTLRERQVEKIRYQESVCPSVLSETIERLDSCLTPAQIEQIECKAQYRPSSETQQYRVEIILPSDVSASLVRYYRNSIVDDPIKISGQSSFSFAQIASLPRESVGRFNPTTCKPKSLFELGAADGEVEILRNQNNLVMNSANNGTVLVNNVNLLEVLNQQQSDQQDQLAFLEANADKQDCKVTNELLELYTFDIPENGQFWSPKVRSKSETLAAPQLCQSPLSSPGGCPNYCSRLRSNFLEAFPYMLNPLECPAIEPSETLRKSSKSYSRLQASIKEFQQAACPSYQICLACAASKRKDENVQSWAAVSRTAMQLIGEVEFPAISEDLNQAFDQMTIQEKNAYMVIWESVLLIWKSTPQFGWFVSTAPSQINLVDTIDISTQTNVWQGFQKFNPNSMIGSDVASELDRISNKPNGKIDISQVLEKSTVLGAYASWVGAVYTYLKQHGKERYQGHVSRQRCHELYQEDLFKAVQESIKSLKISSDKERIEEEKAWNQTARNIVFMDLRLGLSERLVPPDGHAPSLMCSTFSTEQIRACFDNTNHRVESYL